VKITTAAEVCVGCGQCALAVPAVFDQDERFGTVLLLDARPPEELHGPVRAAAVNCPVQAISVGEN
jgi:ferredoxin